MVVRLVVLVVAAGLAYVVWDHGRTIDESHVHQYYERQLEAIRNFDDESLCSDIAEDFSSNVTTHVDGRSTGKDVYDGEAMCRMSRDMTRSLSELSRQTNGLLTFDVSVNVRSINVAPGRRSATVEGITTVKMGDVLVSRSRGTERLSRSLWRVRTHGGEGQAWYYF